MFCLRCFDFLEISSNISLLNPRAINAVELVDVGLAKELAFMRDRNLKLSSELSDAYSTINDLSGELAAASNELLQLNTGDSVLLSSNLSVSNELNSVGDDFCGLLRRLNDVVAASENIVVSESEQGALSGSITDAATSLLGSHMQL